MGDMNFSSVTVGNNTQTGQTNKTKEKSEKETKEATAKKEIANKYNSCFSKVKSKANKVSGKMHSCKHIVDRATNISEELYKVQLENIYSDFQETPGINSTPEDSYDQKNIEDKIETASQDATKKLESLYETLNKELKAGEQQIQKMDSYLS